MKRPASTRPRTKKPKAAPSRERTRSNDPEGLRRRVLDVAAGLFQARGYASTGMQDIFDAAEVTSGAFYHHFASKKDLGLTVVRERVGAAVEEAWLAPVRDARTTLAGVRAVFASIGKELDRNRAVRGCPLNNLTLELAFADADFRSELKAQFDTWRDVLAAKLKQDMERRLVRRRNAAALAAYVISVYSGAMALAKVEQRSQPLEDCLIELSAVLDDGRKLR